MARKKAKRKKPEPGHHDPDWSKAYMHGSGEGGHWIQGAIKHPGALRHELGVKPGKTIPAKKLEKAAKSKGKLGQRARFAEFLKGLHKKKK